MCVNHAASWCIYCAKQACAASIWILGHCTCILGHCTIDSKTCADQGLQHSISSQKHTTPAVSFAAGVARAVRVLNAVVTVRPPAEFMRQRSSQEALSAMDTSSVSSASPGAGSLKGLDGHRRNSTQVVTAHDNGQVQVWDMSTGFLQPVLRMGLVGPSARSALPAHNTIFANTFPCTYQQKCSSLTPQSGSICCEPLPVAHQTSDRLWYGIVTFVSLLPCSASVHS